MSITATQLSKTGARGKDIDTIVRDQLQIIDDKLLRADRSWGRNVVTYDLPNNMSLPGLEKRDAQRIVYSSIIKSLVLRGFEVRLLLEKNQTVLYIAWVTILNVEELEAMNKLLHDVRITRTELNQFLQRGTSAVHGKAPVTLHGGKRAAVERKVGIPVAVQPATLPSWAAGGSAVPPPPPRAAVSTPVVPMRGPAAAAVPASAT